MALQRVSTPRRRSLGAPPRAQPSLVANSTGRSAPWVAHAIGLHGFSPLLPTSPARSTYESCPAEHSPHRALHLCDPHQGRKPTQAPTSSCRVPGVPRKTKAASVSTSGRPPPAPRVCPAGTQQGKARASCSFTTRAPQRSSSSTFSSSGRGGSCRRALRIELLPIVVAQLVAHASAVQGFAWADVPLNRGGSAQGPRSRTSSAGRGVSARLLRLPPRRHTALARQLRPSRLSPFQRSGLPPVRCARVAAAERGQPRPHAKNPPRVEGTRWATQTPCRSSQWRAAATRRPIAVMASTIPKSSPT